MADFAVGFDAFALSNIDSIPILKTNFTPKPPGTNMVLEDHQVRINTEQRTHHGIKYYLVDIVIEAIYHSLNLVDMLKDQLSILQNEPGERPHDARRTPARGLGKLKNVLGIS